MKIDVQHIAKLARLRIEADKLEKFERDMQAIVDMVEQLPDVAITDNGLSPEAPMLLREDRAHSGKYARDELLANAPSVQAGCFVVPKTVE